MDAKSNLAKLSDDEAQDCLNALCKGLILDDDAGRYASLFQQPSEMRNLVNNLAIESDLTPPIGDLDHQSPAAVRAVLCLLAEDLRLAQQIVAWCAVAQRPTRLEPVTSALALAGIIVLLQTKIVIDVKKSPGGKISWSLHVEKTAVATEILSKFFALFKV